jgi:pimeloyl-ACP methyl ester carboxylesterase
MATVSLSYDDNNGTDEPAFVFIHGWTCNRSFFAPQYDYFGQSHRAVAVDLRGHGDSPAAPDGDYSIDAFAGDVAELIDTLALGPAVVVGHSLGGVITCALAAARPDLVRCAVMVDPAPFVAPAAIKDALDSLFGAIGGPDGLATRTALVEGMFMPSDDPERKAVIARVMEVTPHDIAAPAITSLLTFDGPAALAAVQCPIATINSDGPVNDVLEMKRLNPRFMASQTLGAGHFNQLEVPEQVNAMIEQFVRISA